MSNGGDSAGRERFARCASCGKNWTVAAHAWGAGMACPSCGMPVPPGAALGHIQLMREMSSGGLGSVSEAIDSTTGRLVAVKMLHAKLFADPGFVAQFEREARIAASLNHPNVAQVFEFGREADKYYLVMELLEHGTLASRIARGPVPEAELLRIALDVARGLQAASARGLLHRDVKPGNILFDADGRAKLVDFGLAMPLAEVGREQGNAWGSPYYVPPERLEGKPEDARSDIYSLGAALFHAAAGRPPFKATTASIAAWKHLKAQRVSVKAFAPNLSEETATIINRCIERRAEDRFQNHAELIAVLESAFKHATLAKPSPARATSDVIGTERDSSLALWWIALGAFAVMAIGGGALFLHKRGAQDVLGTEAPGAAAPPPQDAAPPRPVAAAPTLIRFSEAEGYLAGELDNHPDWQTDTHPTWQVPAGAGLVRVPGEIDGERRVFFRKPARLGEGETLRGEVRFRFGGLGTATDPEPWRVILSTKIADRTKSGDRGFEINWVKMSSRPDGYEIHVKVLPRASETGDQIVLGTVWARNSDVGDDADAPGDPTDELQLAYAVSKGTTETSWAIEVTLSNLTKGRVIETFRKDNIATQRECFEAGSYYGSLGGRPWGQKLEVLGWSFAGTETGGTGGDAEFKSAQGYVPGDLGLHPDWQIKGPPAWGVVDGGGSVRYTHPGSDDSSAMYRPMATLPPGGVIRGSVRYSFDCYGLSVDPEYRDILKLCICPDLNQPGEGVEMVSHRSKDSEKDYNWHIRTTRRVSGTGELGSIRNVRITSADAGDRSESPGAPSDILQFDYELRKGADAAHWSFMCRLFNVTTGKEIGGCDRVEFSTVPEFHAMPGYYGSMRGRGFTTRIDVHAWRFTSGNDDAGPH